MICLLGLFKAIDYCMGKVYINTQKLNVYSNSFRHCYILERAFQGTGWLRNPSRSPVTIALVC